MVPWALGNLYNRTKKLPRPPADGLGLILKGFKFLLAIEDLHITPVLLKIVERAIKIPLDNYLEATDGFGESQWAFRKKRGCTDLVLLLVCSCWLLAFQRRREVGCF